VNADGDSALSIAACERFSEVIQVLLDNGANPDHQNKEGRSPLMEAALWGRIDNVKCLLEHGANGKLGDICSRQAADFAVASSRNDKERSCRSGSDFQGYREDIFVAS
jgi:ankyrin repeat protein